MPRHIVEGDTAGGDLLGTYPDPSVVGGTGGGGSLAVQDFNKAVASATTWYEAVAAKGTATSANTWTIIKFTLSGNNYQTTNVYTATDAWDNYLTATYTLSNSYNT